MRRKFKKRFLLFILFILIFIISFFISFIRFPENSVPVNGQAGTVSGQVTYQSDKTGDAQESNENTAATANDNTFSGPADISPAGSTVNSSTNTDNQHIDTLVAVDSTKAADDNKKEPLIEIKGLVELLKIDDSFVIDLKYATDDNFTGKAVYTQAKCIINKNTAQKLIKANNEFKKLGYTIKIFDAYRPSSAQKILWDAAEDKSFVANPKIGSNHSKGAAVDVTLVNSKGEELAMPSDYDEMSPRAAIKYTDCPQEQIDNRELLAKIMVKYGFKRISTEWWHFDDTDASKYPILDVPFEQFS